jgi:maltose O-acetyltransferase
VDPGERRRGVEYALPIAIGANVWIAAGVVIGPGVTIGDDTVVGAGSVVLDDLPAGIVAAGNPARIVRRL